MQRYVRKPTTAHALPPCLRRVFDVIERAAVVAEELEGQREDDTRPAANRLDANTQDQADAIVKKAPRRKDTQR